jgi:glycosyltransferase involved in cell wall biosynthesis
MDLSVSVIIPARNAGRHLTACLERVRDFLPAPLECVVVDDGSTDDSAEIARRAGVRVVSTGGQRGPAIARNLGARDATGDIFFFLDADVLAPADALSRIRPAFAEDPELAALIGSYDEEPGAPEFASQYRNLLHCYIHQSSRAETATFWTGCGAIRREVFEAHGGFRQTYEKPYLEDIEFGWRLHQAGRRVRLDKQLRVKHLKRWGFWKMMQTDLLDRAVPWTHLILRFRSMPADLNLRWEQRASVLLVGLLAGGAALELSRMAVTLDPAPWWAWVAAAAGGGAAQAWLNRGFYRFLAQRKGLWFALRALPLHGLYFLASGLGFAIGLLRYPWERRAVRAAEPGRD